MFPNINDGNENVEKTDLRNYCCNILVFFWGEGFLLLSFV